MAADLRARLVPNRALRMAVSNFAVAALVGNPLSAGVDDRDASSGDGCGTLIGVEL